MYFSSFFLIASFCPRVFISRGRFGYLKRLTLSIYNEYNYYRIKANMIQQSGDNQDQYR